MIQSTHISPRDNFSPSIISRGGIFKVRRLPLLVGVFLLAFFVLLAVAFGLWQGRASRSISARLQGWRAEGTPYDNITADQYYKKRTHQEGTEAWMKILALSYWGSEFPSVRELPIVGTVDAPDLSKPIDQWPDNWPDERLVSEYLEGMKPMFELIDQSRKYSKPVYLPIRFNGFYTLLQLIQDVRQVQRVLSLECFYAIYKKDSDRALQALRGMQETIEAFDSTLFMVGELVAIACDKIKHDAVRYAVSQDIWTDQQLEMIRTEILKPRFQSSAWRTMANMERTYLGSEDFSREALSTGNLSAPLGSQIWSRLPMFSTCRLKLYEMYDSIADLEQIPLEQLQAAAAAIDAKWRSDWNGLSIDGYGYYSSLFAPSLESLVGAIISEEDSLRMTRTAVSLRMYKKLNGKWPSDLAELATTGLAMNQISSVKKGDFGYSVEGDFAWLWSYPLDNTGAIPKTRPQDSRDSGLTPHIRMQ